MYAMRFQQFLLLFSEIVLAVFQCVTGVGAAAAIMGRPVFTVAHTWPMLFSLQTGVSWVTLTIFIGVAATADRGIECYGAARLVMRHIVTVAWMSFVLMIAAFAIVDDAKTNNLLDATTGGLRTGNAISLSMFSTVGVYSRWQIIMASTLFIAISNVNRVGMTLIDMWNGMSHGGIALRDPSDTDGRRSSKQAVWSRDDQNRRFASDMVHRVYVSRKSNTGR